MSELQHRATTLDSAGWRRRGEEGPAVVALGGGHGLSATLRALRHVTHRLTAVVTVADDGGSSGRLRQEFDCLPPGDLRMALASLTDDSEWGLTWRDVLQHRFAGQGELDNHALGNLLILALWQLLGDEVEGLDWVGRLLAIHGRVVPMSSSPLVIEADVVDGARRRRVRGQVAVATARGRLENVCLEPSDAVAHPEAVRAIDEADWVVLGPGSWYTSVLPHLILPSMRQALMSTSARKVAVLNLSTQRGETDGMSPADHLRVLSDYAPGFGLDVVLADPSTVDDLDSLAQVCEQMGATLVLRQVRSGDGSCLHDPLRLAAAFRDAFDDVLGDVEADRRAEQEQAL
ncbi:MAG: uridine diphosphate-N-acetylglucosamine-binding protein YvcK [Actinomyces urogenitalis]|nr:uridine diphosphate-N-acetylglucosamine-binding protein YvcK [Actinomyces urogenitalis]MBS6071563.1 uridine diphosphate-N-acetylglucosamine-binding protein YvcK [Actinomyces urogenitalis]MCI7457060.1 uridine diphosphate-N-acetylglucosamine-binding protein YvcK [Actinomyces urogenitalis]MDY3678989.1 uridine diphosphate-N-acetylglucosamine-binding protein YvcK [Actinomyces urogenitalis]